MVQYDVIDLDVAFAALADGTRRGVLEQLGRSERSITDLAERFGMTLTGMRKHVGVLEAAGLVTTEKVGRVRVCRLETRALSAAERWFRDRRALWERRLDALEEVLRETDPDRPKKRGPR